MVSFDIVEWCQRLWLIDGRISATFKNMALSPCPLRSEVGWGTEMIAQFKDYRQLIPRTVVIEELRRGMPEAENMSFLQTTYVMRDDVRWDFVHRSEIGALIVPLWSFTDLLWTFLKKFRSKNNFKLYVIEFSIDRLRRDVRDKPNRCPNVVFATSGDEFT